MEQLFKITASIKKDLNHRCKKENVIAPNFKENNVKCMLLR